MSHSKIKAIRHYFLNGIIILLLLSCTKEVDIPIEVSNQSINACIIINELPGYSYYNGKREIFIYGSYTDFISKINPVYYDFNGGTGNPSTIYLSDIKSEVLYLRVTLWETVSYSDDFFLNRGSYYYIDSIAVPNFNCLINVVTVVEKWKMEEE